MRLFLRRTLCVMALTGLLLGWLQGTGSAEVPQDYFEIKVTDGETGRGVPLVELRTDNEILYVTDSNGVVAFREPGLMGRKVYFSIKSHGYEAAADGFGYRGAAVETRRGGSVILKVKRLNIAERLCRLTGAGIYGDSLLVNAPVPLREPALDGQVLGQDSALAVVYRGRMLWFWGDTSRPDYPLGNFHTTGAVATLPKGTTTADQGLDFRYFTQADGFVKAMCPSTKPGPIWIGGVAVVGTPGKEELYAHYVRVENLAKNSEQGVVRWDDVQNVFQFVREIPVSETWRFLDGHPIHLQENGADYLAGGFCFPVVRVPADAAHLLDPTAFEAYTCLTAGGEVLRDTQGAVVYRWQKELPPMLPQQEDDLVKKGKLKPEEAHFLPQDKDGNALVPHGGSVTWNPWRKKWLLIATQRDGKESALGEILYSEADGPCGPWRKAVKIVTHDHYTFYNPVHHPFLDAAGGRLIYFEGTYTAEFSGNTNLTPRYNYNQILYRLDLSDARLKTVQ